jgi:1,4-dihydroxy-2-naphthoyl-CoA synthase
MTDSLTLVEERDGIAIVTLNRPEKRNALSQALRHEIVARLDAFEKNESVRCVVLRIVQTAGLLFQRGSIRDAQSKWRVGAGPVTAAEIAEFSPGCALPLPASGR